LVRTIRKAVPDIKSTQNFGETGRGAFLLGIVPARAFNDAFGYVKYACKAVPFRNLVLHDTTVEERKRQTDESGTRFLNGSVAMVAQRAAWVQLPAQADRDRKYQSPGLQCDISPRLAEQDPLSRG